MSDRSTIEWTDSTFNPWIGCTKISPACDHCYAEAQMDTRLHRVSWGANMARLRTSPANWRTPLAWNTRSFFACRECLWRGEDPVVDREDDEAPGGVSGCCPRCGGPIAAARRRVFCASLADVFDNEVDPAWRTDLFELIRATPNLDWLLLTKRIGNAKRMMEEALPFSVGLGAEPLTNVWLGATICDQVEADRDIPKLLAAPAAVRFLSMEPLLGPVDLTSVAWPNKGGHRVDTLRAGYWNMAGVLAGGPSAELGAPRGGFTNHSDMARLDWVIAGGESGPHARPSHPDWLRSLRDQCAAAGVPILFKQWGEWLPVEADGDLPVMALDGSERYLPGTVSFDTSFNCVMARVGKRAAGRLLDGREHSEFPSPQRSSVRNARAWADEIRRLEQSNG